MRTRTQMLVLVVMLVACIGAQARELGNREGNTMQRAPGDSSLENSDGTFPSWAVVDVISTGCNSGDFGFDTVFFNVTSPAFAHTTADAGGDRYMNEQFDYIASFGGHTDARPDDWFLFDLDDGGASGPTTGTWPIPDDTPVTVNFMIRDAFDGTLQFQRRVVVDGCNTGNIVSNVVVNVGGPSQPIPTMGRIGLAITAAVLLLLGGLALRRGRA